MQPTVCLKLFALTLCFISGSYCRSVPCPSRYDMGCHEPPTPCPADRPHSVTSYHYVNFSRCTGCSYCVESLEECPYLPCPLYYIPPGCNPRVYNLQLDIGDQTCWACDYIQCLH